MDIKKARRKSFDVEYVEVTEENIEEVAEWCQGTLHQFGGHPYIRLTDKNVRNPRQAKAFGGDLVVFHPDISSYKSFSKAAFSKAFDELVDENFKERMDREQEEQLSRDAGTGKFVTEEYAAENPDTTVVETVELPRDADPS